MRNVSKQVSHQHGQVLPITVVFLLIILSVMLFIYNSGQMVQEKLRLTNTADAAAMGGANRVTRMLNYISYTNRAQVINSINIGYAVGLASWLEQTRMAVKNMAEFDSDYDQQVLLTVYPGFKFGPMRSLMEENQRLYNFMLKNAILSHWSAQKAMAHHVGSGAVMDAEEEEGEIYRDFGSVIRTVRKFNRLNYALEKGYEPGYKYSMSTGWASDQRDKYEGDKEALGGSKAEEEFYAKMVAKDSGKSHSEVLFDFDWSHDVPNTSFAKRGENEPLDRMIEVTRAERENHDFLTDRGWNAVTYLYKQIGPYRIMIPGVAKKRGSSELYGDQADGWGALDSLSVHWVGLVEHKFGWAHAASNSDVDGEDNGFAGSRSDNPNAHSEAKNNSVNGFPTDQSYDQVTEWAVGAVPNYGELGPAMMEKDDPIFYTTARNYRKVNATRTIAAENELNSNAIKPAGRLEIYEGNMKENDQIEYSSIASAQSYFDRPEKRADGREEKGSMFNPYWHTALVTVSDENRRKAQEQHGEFNNLDIYLK